MKNIFDAHAHYDDKWFDEDRDTLLSSMKENGVSFIVNAAVDIPSTLKAIELSEKYDFIYSTAGFHPENLENLPEDYLEQIEKLSQHKKVVAIGEIGLDYHWDIPKDIQKKAFEEQLILSKNLDMPVVIHDREAHGDTMQILQNYMPKALLHCYSGSVEMMREYVKMGIYISLGGVVTFKNARQSVEVAKDVPLDRLLLETDAPYLAPVPNRGKRCDSSMILYTAQRIAEIKNMDVQELLDITAQNAKTFYNIK